MPRLYSEPCNADESSYCCVAHIIRRPHLAEVRAWFEDLHDLSSRMVYQCTQSTDSARSPNLGLSMLLWQKKLYESLVSVGWLSQARLELDTNPSTVSRKQPQQIDHKQ
jgi:hypothetical protein